MSDKSPRSPLRFMAGLMLGAALVLICIAVWMILKDEGAPVFVPLSATTLGAFAAVLASQISKKSGG